MIEDRKDLIKYLIKQEKIPKIDDLNKLLTKMKKKEVCWNETVVPGYIRAHYDRERYLSDCEDILISDILKFAKKDK